MAVFAQNERARFPLVVQKAFFHPLQRRIHAAYDVEHAVVILVRALDIHVVLVVHGAAVARFEFERRLSEAPAVARLVAERPHDHARAVFVALVHRDRALADRRFVKGIVGELIISGNIVPAVGIHHAVRFHVRFVDDVKTVFVAQAVEFGRVGIMRSSDRIDVELFHELQVPAHILDADDGARYGMGFMPINAEKFDGLSVKEKHAVLNFRFANTNLFAYDLFAADDGKRVEIGAFGAPKAGIFHAENRRFPRGNAPLFVGKPNGALPAAQESEIHLRALFR